MNLRRFDSIESASLVLASQIVTALRTALGVRSRASLALPGGRTPVPLFRALRAAELDWSRVRITLTDERWLPETSAASNGALMRRELFVDNAAAADFVPLFSGAATAAAGADAASHAVREMLPFDAVVLGMGADGHFASLFAGSPGVAAALDPAAPAGCVAMRAPVEPVERLSLNLAALSATRQLNLLVTGADKLAVLERAANGSADAALPVAALLALQRPVVDVFWAS